MKLFGEQVKHTSTNSSLNIIRIENFEEIFFNVYEIELNKGKYPVEKISEHNGNPVVSVPVRVGENEKYYPFVLIKGKPEIIFNENSVAIEQELFETGSNERELARIEGNREILEQIERAKKTAKRELHAAELRKKKTLRDDYLKKDKLLKETLSLARDQLVNEFISVSKKIKDELSDSTNERFQEISETIDNKIADLSNSLKESLNQDFTTSGEQFDSKLHELVKEMYSATISPKIDRELREIAVEIVEKVGAIESSLYEKVQNKADIALVDEINSNVSTLRSSNIELHDTINKGVNKALSRVGNVNTKVDDLTIALSEEVESKIRQTEENISKYYSEKLKLLEEKTFDVTEQTRKYIIELVEESRNNLISEIRKIKNEKPIQYVMESKGGKTTMDFDNLEKTLHKKFSEKIDTEVTRLRRYIAVYSGGGSVAMQFADGGTMNGSLNVKGDLTIFGSISAQNYSGLPNYTGIYLPLSGGNLNGNLNVFGSVSAQNYLGLNIPLQNYLPLSGGNLSGTLFSNSSATFVTLSSSGITYALGGNSNCWNSAYTTMLGNSANWENTYTTFSSTSGNYAVLSDGKIPLVNIPDSLIGQVKYQGLWNPATNVPYLSSIPLSAQAGYYWICSNSATTVPAFSSTALSSTYWEVGDWIIDNSSGGISTWGKVNNTDAVTLVAGRKGNVVLSTGDVSGLGNVATLNIGTTTNTVCAGNDSRLSDARTPTAHASSHSAGQADPISPANIGAAYRRVYQTSSFTAVAYGRYHTAGTVTVTDPANPSEGDIFDVVIVTGTAVVGGVTYSPSRWAIERVYSGGSWITLTPYTSDATTIAAQLRLTAQASTDDNSALTIGLQRPEPLWNVTRFIQGSIAAITGVANGNCTLYSNSCSIWSGTNNSSKGGCRMFSNPFFWAVGSSGTLPGSRPLSVAMNLNVVLGTNTTSVIRVFVGGDGTMAVADAAEPVTLGGFGVIFYYSGGIRARLFWRKDASTPTVYSGSGTGSGTIPITCAAYSLLGIVLENPGNGNLNLYVQDGNAAYTAGVAIAKTADIAWTGAITNLTATHTGNVEACAVNAATASGSAMLYLLNSTMFV